jgi:hypothetical protein
MFDHDAAYCRHLLTRRRFLQRTSCGLGVAALASILQAEGYATTPAPKPERVKVGGVLGQTHFAPRVKNVIYLFMGGGPSHVDLYDHKPMLRKTHDKELPKSVLGEQRVTLMTRNQGHFKAVAAPYGFVRYGKCGQEMSELLPRLGAQADDLCLIRSLYTEPINHDPAVTFMQTGRPQPGLPCMGSWVDYGLGSVNRDLPAFVVMISGLKDQPIPSRYYHSGFLPSQHQGVQFQAGNDPVLYLSNPQGMAVETRGDLIRGINELNRLRHAVVHDPEIETRINSFELAFRMQTSVPELMDVRKEPTKVLDSYGPDVKTPGSFARNCLLARRLVERGVRFVQLFHRGWDHHNDLANRLKKEAGTTDQPTAALVADLRQRGLFDETLVIWGGEFGRTAYGQNTLGGSSGRDHHPRCFTIWLAGGGVKGGISVGKTDDFGYNLAGPGVHVNDLHATILHLLGIDHTRLIFRFGGRDFRLTDVAGKVVKELLT